MVQQIEGIQITDKSKTGKIMRMSGLEEYNNIEEDKKSKVKVLSSEIIVAIPDKPESKMFNISLD